MADPGRVSARLAAEVIDRVADGSWTVEDAEASLIEAAELHAVAERVVAETAGTR